MRRQHDLHDLLTAAAVMLRAPAACLALPERGAYRVIATYGALPDTFYPSAPLEGGFNQQCLSPHSELAKTPWNYAFQSSFSFSLPDGQGVLCFLTRQSLAPESTVCLEGLEAIMRQIVQVLDRPTADDDHDMMGTATAPLQCARHARGHLPSIEDLPGIGTFEIRFGSHSITLSAELMRLTGIPTGAQCAVDLFARCMPVPDADMLHFADGTREEIMLSEKDYAIRNLSDLTQRWVRRRAEIEVDDQGRPWRLIGTIEDITRDRVATNRLAAMVILGDALRQVDTPDEAYHAAASAMGEALDADRAGWAMIEPGDDTCFRVMRDWHDPALPSASGLYRRADYHAAFGVLDQGLLLAVRDARENVWLPCVLPNCGGVDQVRAQLLMPVMTQGRMTHCFFVQALAPRDWSDQELAFTRAVSDRAQAAAASLEARAHQATLHQELAHRLKNTLALVQALANQSLREVENRDAVRAFEKRLVALGSAHDLLMRQSWQRGDLAQLAREVLSRVGPIERFQLEGEPLSVGPNTAMTLGLMLHELGTNAVKYGALSVETGTVSLCWKIVTEYEQDILSLHWVEKGGPPVVPPARSGFGSRLLRAGFGHQGHVALHYPPTGCDAQFQVPLRQAQTN